MAYGPRHRKTEGEELCREGGGAHGNGVLAESKCVGHLRNGMELPLGGPATAGRGVE